MALSALSKHCIISSSFVFIYALIYAASRIDGGPNSETMLSYLAESYKIDAFMAVLVICNLLMIVGIHKRRVLLMIPFYFPFVAVICLACYQVFYVWSFSPMSSVYEICWKVFGVIAVAFTLINPFVAVFLEVCRERSVKRKQHVQHGRV